MPICEGTPRCARRVALHRQIRRNVEPESGSPGDARILDVEHTTCTKHQSWARYIPSEQMGAKRSFLCEERIVASGGQSQSSTSKYTTLPHMSSQDQRQARVTVLTV